MSNKIFVYGTLKPGGALHYIIESFVVNSFPDSVSGSLCMTDYGFPALMPGDDVVPGVVLECEDIEHVLYLLDILEGAPSFYKRKLITTHKGEECHCYFAAAVQHYITHKIGEFP